MGQSKLELFSGKDRRTRRVTIMLLIATALCSGCAFLNKEQGYVDDKPQNSPASWERNTFGVGF
jgi:hypothetical protein